MTIEQRIKDYEDASGIIKQAWLACHTAGNDLGFRLMCRIKDRFQEAFRQEMGYGD